MAKRQSVVSADKASTLSKEDALFRNAARSMGRYVNNAPLTERSERQQWAVETLSTAEEKKFTIGTDGKSWLPSKTQRLVEYHKHPEKFRINKKGVLCRKAEKDPNAPKKERKAPSGPTKAELKNENADLRSQNDALRAELAALKAAQKSA